MSCVVVVEVRFFWRLFFFDAAWSWCPCFPSAGNARRLDEPGCYNRGDEVPHVVHLSASRMLLLQTSVSYGRTNAVAGVTICLLPCLLSEKGGASGSYVTPQSHCDGYYITKLCANHSDSSGLIITPMDRCHRNGSQAAPRALLVSGGCYDSPCPVPRRAGCLSMDNGRLGPSQPSPQTPLPMSGGSSGEYACALPITSGCQ